MVIIFTFENYFCHFILVASIAGKVVEIQDLSLKRFSLSECRLGGVAGEASEALCRGNPGMFGGVGFLVRWRLEATRCVGVGWRAMLGGI